MANAIGTNCGIAGIGEESIYGTPVAVTKFVEVISENLKPKENFLKSKAINRVFRDISEVYLGTMDISGDLKYEQRYEGTEVLLKHALGSVASSEVSTFTVSAVNKYLDFNIGAAELTATIAEGSYTMGTNQVTSSSLCKAIYDAIVAAEATGTYTVTFSQTTKKITIARSAGSFALLFKTGTHGSDNTDTHIGTLIGYDDTSDKTGALTYTASNAVVTVHTHTFSQAVALPTGLTVEVDKGVEAYTIEGGKINTMAFSCEAGGFLEVSIGLIGEAYTAGTATSPTLSDSKLLSYTGASITYGGVSKNVKKFDLTLNNNLTTDRRFIGLRNIAEPLRSGKAEVTATLDIDFDSDDEYDDFRALTSRALVITFTGTEIKSGQNYTLTFTMSNVIITDGPPPAIDSEGVISVSLSLECFTSTAALNDSLVIALKNTIAAVSA